MTRRAVRPEPAQPALEHELDPELAGDLGRVGGVGAAGEARGPGGDRDVLEPRKLRQQVLGDAVREELVFRGGAGERKDRTGYALVRVDRR